MRYFIAAAVLSLSVGMAHAQTYDLVIEGARVVDPETALDQVRNIGITGDEIAIVTPEPITGASVIDATGLIAAPGFIDLHAHGQDRYSEKVSIFDGRTTQMDLEAGALPVSDYFAAKAGAGDNQTFVVFCQDVFVNTGTGENSFPLHPLEMGNGGEFHQVAIALGIFGEHHLVIAGTALLFADIAVNHIHLIPDNGCDAFAFAALDFLNVGVGTRITLDDTIIAQLIKARLQVGQEGIEIDFLQTHNIGVGILDSVKDPFQSLLPGELVQHRSGSR